MGKFYLIIMFAILLNSLILKGNNDKILIENSFSPGAFEIYMVPQKYNFLARDDVADKVWSSHIPETKNSKKFVEKLHSGTDHGSLHYYDMHVPIILFGEKFINQGKSNKKVFLTDIVPTMSKMLNMETPSYAFGNPLKEAIKKTTEKPRIIMLFVIDQAGWNYFKSHPKATPFISSLIEKGFLYKNAYLNFIQSSTAVAHAVIGTGALPKHTGIYENAPFNRGINRPLKAYMDQNDNYALNHLRVPTFADLWDIKTGNRAIVFVYSSVVRAAIGLAGHGKEFSDGDKDTVFWYDGKEEKFTTYGAAFNFPEKVNNYKFSDYMHINGQKEYWKKQKCMYKGKVYKKCLVGSPSFVRFEGDVLLSALKNQKDLGKDNISDLVFISFKGTDYCSHSLGSESLECAETLSEVDGQIEKIVKYLNLITQNSSVVIVTADHGAAPLTELSGGTILNAEKFLNDINGKFIRDESKTLVKKMSNSLLNLDLGLMKSKNIKISDVKKFLEDYKVNGKKFFKKIYTYEEFN